MTVNVEKRTKRFKRLFTDYQNHPYYNKIFELYLNDELKTVRQVNKYFRKIRITKKNTVHKRDIKTVNEIEKKLKNTLNKNIQDQQIININENNWYNEFGRNMWGFWVHKNVIHKMMEQNQDTIIIHNVDFYINNEKQYTINYYVDNDEYDEETINLKQDPLKFIFTETNLTINEIDNRTIYRVTLGGSKGIWIVAAFREYCQKNNNYNWDVKLTTTSYKKIINDNTQLSLLQKYAFNNTGTCVYDGLLSFFSKYSESKNKNAKAILNKLIIKYEKYAKPYTIEEMKTLGEELNCSFTINDLINKEDIEINKNSSNKYNINFVNTRYNHLDLLQCVSNIQEVSTEYYNHCKELSTFYVERLGNLLTLDGNYKIKNEYSELVNEWKEIYDINACSIEINSDINKFINKYDDKVHRFFNNKMKIDDKLYEELDIRKAYYNYDKSTYYNGLPSGAYISCTGEGMTNEIFLDQYNNKLVGFYEVIINSDNELLNYLGLCNGSRHVLFSATIKLLIDKNIKLDYINYVISPSKDAPFDGRFNNKFLLYVDGDELVTDEERGNKELVKAYCKVVGCMMIESNNFSIDIKPDNKDDEFYKTLINKEDIFNIDGIYKIIKQKTDPKSLKHMALAIHAYSSNIILEQLFNMNKNDIYGVKVDSIIFKKGAQFEYNTSLFKEPSPAKIQNMIKNIGVNDERPHEFDINNDAVVSSLLTNNNLHEYFKPYFLESTNDINFDKSFCSEHIKSRVICLGGAGGCGKTYSILTSKNFMMNDLLFTSTCWELIQDKVDEFNNITGISLPKLTGEMNGKEVEKFNNTKYKYIVNDELTLQSYKTVNTIIKDNKDKFIILMGDVEKDGFFYQCSIGGNVFNPSKIQCQYIKYTKNYRFDEPFNNKINDLRAFMNKNRGKTDLLYSYVKKEFNGCFKKFKEINFNENDVGISALKPIGKDGKCLYSHHFYKKGVKEQFYITNTIYKKGLYRGAKLDEEPDNKNYTNSLFRTIHAYQGRQLTQDNKIIILLNSLFDFNLLYTAISRARRLDQIIILDMIKK